MGIFMRYKIKSYINIHTWLSGELGREAQDEFDEEGERGSSFT